MNRRSLLRLLALGGAGTATLPMWVVRLTDVALAQTAAPARAARLVLSPHQDATVAAISELIIPQTDTAGARAARVNEFIDAVVADADPPERDRFLNGLAWVDRRSRELHGADFVSSNAEQQASLLVSISDATAGAPSTGRDFFRSIKALTITGYYTSKIGMREELGDEGRTGFADYAGCTHPDHKVSA